MRPTSLLVTLSGNDRPGVTQRLFSSLSPFDVVVDDVEQLVIRGHLVLSALISAHGDRPDETLDATRATVRALAGTLDMDCATVLGTGEETPGLTHRVHVTVLGSPLVAADVASVADVIASHRGNIDRIRRIASYPVTAIVLECSGVDVHVLSRALTQRHDDLTCDIAVRRADIDSRGQHLVVMDVDSTVIQDEVIDLLADEAGVMERVAEITERAMAGELDFSASLRERVSLLTGLDSGVLERVRERVRLTPGARTLCRTLTGLGYRVCLVSGGFVEIVAPLARELGVTDVRANQLEIIDGRLTGRVVGPIVDRAGKRAALEAFASEYGIPMRRTIAIGDGANDVDMLEAAGLGVAFNAKAAARAAADTSISVPYLDSVLFLLGITREEIEANDAAR